MVPVHGRAALTRRCLDLVLAELPPGCELIVVDDASTDDTAALLGCYSDAIQVVSLPQNLGYAGACNAGAASASHGLLLFLNNDTEPCAGWLASILRYARLHPRAAVIGAKLLDPIGRVQHAGVTIGQDGYPHNLYAGLPGDHPAANRSRALQAVTGACMLVRRAAFESVGGFDPEYLNSLEDVDLCMRIGRAGGEVHYCHEAQLIHLESASRGKEDRFQRSVERYRRLWREQARRDDLAIYAEDGLLEVEYPERYPVRVTISPQLAVVDDARGLEIESLLELYAWQATDLLAEVVRLTAMLGSGSDAPADVEVPPGRKAPADGRARGEMDRDARLARRRQFLTEVNHLEEQIWQLQTGLQNERDGSAPESGERFSATRRLGYRAAVERVRRAVVEHVPEGASVLVVSRGDRDLVKLAGRKAEHFPQAAAGGYAGHHPRDSEDAIARLEQLRARGADFLVLPSTECWWLEHYEGFARHLRNRYPVVALEACSIYGLASGRGRPPSGARA